MTDWSAITSRQAQVLDALVQHGSNKAAARELGIAPRTFEVHLENIAQRIGLSNRGSRVLMAVRWDRHRRTEGATT